MIDEIVAQNLCIGCGTCAGICPKQTLRISFNDFGEYVAKQISGDCHAACSLCVKVCPFSNQTENEDTLADKLFRSITGIQHRPEVGYFYNAFVGYSTVDGHRVNGASGGLATWTLETLLQHKLVDKVVCVKPSENAGKLFFYDIFHTVEEIRQCSGSCYSPVEMSGVIAHIFRHESTYAVIGLPCFVKALRLAMINIPRLRKRIRFVLGLVCGQLKSKSYAEYVCALGGGNPNSLRRIYFRVKSPNRTAIDYGIRFEYTVDKESKQSGLVYMSEGPGRIWGKRYFTPIPCNFCDDTFSELADATYMDAWLMPYKNDYKGHSLVVCRDKAISDIICSAIKNGRVKGNYIEISSVIESQKDLLHSKRNLIQERLLIARKAGYNTPHKRIPLKAGRIRYRERLLVQSTWLVQQRSRQEWLGCGKDLARFHSAMLSLEKRAERLRQLNVFSQLLKSPKALTMAAWAKAAKFVKSQQSLT